MKCSISPKWDFFCFPQTLSKFFILGNSIISVDNNDIYDDNISDIIIIGRRRRRKRFIQHLLYSKHHFNIIDYINSLILRTILWCNNNYYTCLQVRKVRLKEFEQITQGHTVKMKSGENSFIASLQSPSKKKKHKSLLPS